MFKTAKKSQGAINMQVADELINELEKNTTDEILKKRAHSRHTVKLPVIVQPANASQMREFKAHGITRDISSGGLGAIFSIPIGVGDIYRLDFQEAHVELPVTIARCVSCSFVRDGTFNVGFKFFSTLSLPDDLSTGGAD